MQRVYQALELSRSVSHDELAPHWEGEDIPPGKVGLWAPLAVAAAVAVGLLLIIYIGLYAWLQWNGAPAKDALRGLNKNPYVQMNRQATAPPVDQSVANTVRGFLKPQIDAGLVEVNPTPNGVGIVTTDKALAFDPGSDQIAANARGLFEQIAVALNAEPGSIRVEGHTDSQPPRGLTFRDNTQLSQARADTVAGLIRSRLHDGARPITAKGFGESRPKDTNDTPLGRARNRRVEIYLDKAGS
jgi:flagellar motor protein MotB